MTAHDTSRRNAMIVLVWGFRVAAAMVLLGSLVSLARRQAVPERLPDIGSIIEAVVHLDGVGFFGLGFFAILLTPIVTTLAIAIAFWREGDRRFTLWSGAVLLILACSLAWSLR